MHPLLALSLLLVFGIVLWVARELATAPEGYQDRDGFHYGRPPNGHPPDDG